MKLKDLPINRKAIITHCNEKYLPLKLMEMGCVDGVEVIFLNKAPLGTPLYYKIGDTRIALGKEIVKEIEVQPIDENDS